MSYICNTEKYKYNKGYLHLPITLNEEKLPKIIEVDGTELQIKSSFHVSLICIKNIQAKYDIPDIDKKIIDLFCDFVQKWDISFKKFTGVFRYAKRDEDERKTLVGMCIIKNLQQFFDVMNIELGLEVLYQPTHVTLYTLEKDEGIGLNSMMELLKLSEDVSDDVSNELGSLL